MLKLVFGLVGALVLAWIALIGWGSWVNAHRLQESPENESPLYRSYAPEQVIKQFRYGREGYGHGHSQGSSHSVLSIHHTQEFTQEFTMQANRERELLKALREDIMLRLRMPGMTVVAANDEADGGFMYRYTSGNSHGSISVQAPVHWTVPRSYPLRLGLDDIDLKIALEETWTRPASETQWWMSAAD